MTKSDDLTVTYDIGFKRPPKSTQFRKGVTGNLYGRKAERHFVESILGKVLFSVSAPNAERNLDFERDFKPMDELAGAVMRLPNLFDSCAITTNFDRVLEMAYDRSGKAFIEKTTGRGPVNAFYRAIPAGERYLLKLHGNLDNAAERVLNRAEYDAAYGNDGNIHFDFPIPKLLRRLYTSFSFLFLGSSLTYDRTIQTFTKVAQDVGADSLPHHYAILGCPSDAAQKAKLELRLADAHISAIWFPEGEYQQIEQMLELLMV